MRQKLTNKNSHYYYYIIGIHLGMLIKLQQSRAMAYSTFILQVPPKTSTLSSI